MKLKNIVEKKRSRSNENTFETRREVSRRRPQSFMKVVKFYDFIIQHSEISHYIYKVLRRRTEKHEREKKNARLARL